MLGEVLKFPGEKTHPTEPVHIFGAFWSFQSSFACSRLDVKGNKALKTHLTHQSLYLEAEVNFCTCYCSYQHSRWWFEALENIYIHTIYVNDILCLDHVLDILLEEFVQADALLVFHKENSCYKNLTLILIIWNIWLLGLLQQNTIFSSDSVQKRQNA